MRCFSCGGRTGRVKTRATNEGFRQTRKCFGCGRRIYIRAIVERVTDPRAEAA